MIGEAPDLDFDAKHGPEGGSGPAPGGKFRSPGNSEFGENSEFRTSGIPEKIAAETCRELSGTGAPRLLAPEIGPALRLLATFRIRPLGA